MINVERVAIALEAEEKALNLIRQCGFFEGTQGLDWVAKNKNNNKWLCFEVKAKELWEPGSNFGHYGIGLDLSQLFLRNWLKADLGIPTYLINYDIKGDVYGGFLDSLMARGGYYDSPNRIRIFPIENFFKGEEAILQDLIGGGNASK